MKPRTANLTSATLDEFHKNMGSGKPFGIIMKTVKGLGVSYMENQVGWHGKAPNDEEYEIAADAFDEWMDSQEFDESDIEE